MCIYVPQMSEAVLSVPNGKIISSRQNVNTMWKHTLNKEE